MGFGPAPTNNNNNNNAFGFPPANNNPYGQPANNNNNSNFGFGPSPSSPQNNQFGYSSPNQQPNNAFNNNGIYIILHIIFIILYLYLNSIWKPTTTT